MKKPGLCGPIDDAFLDSFLIVKPTPGVHTVSTVIAGKQVEQTLRFPADRRVTLAAP